MLIEDEAQMRTVCEQTAWVDLSWWPLTALAQDQKSKRASGEARGRGGLGALTQKFTATGN
jgi:hypothetical protein